MTINKISDEEVEETKEIKKVYKKEVLEKRLQDIEREITFFIDEKKKIQELLNCFKSI